MKNTGIHRLARGSAAITVAGALVVGGATAALADPGHDARGRTGGPSHGQGVGPLAALVSAGTITSSDAAAVSSTLRAAHDAGRDQMQRDHAAEHKAVLDSLVSKGTITRSQADAIAAADRGGVRGLIADGTITQAQADAVRTAMASERETARTARDTQRRTETKNALAKLVSAGTLTQSKADAIATALADRPSGQGGPRGGMGHGRR